MARVTVEDCIDKVQDKFELVVLAAERTKALTAGCPRTVELNDDKLTVIALREIASEGVFPEKLKESRIRSLQINREHSEEEDLLEDSEHEGMEYNVSSELSENDIAENYTELFEDELEIDDKSF